MVKPASKISIVQFCKIKGIDRNRDNIITHDEVKKYYNGDYGNFVAALEYKGFSKSQIEKFVSNNLSKSVKSQFVAARSLRDAIRAKRAGKTDQVILSLQKAVLTARRTPYSAKLKRVIQKSFGRELKKMQVRWPKLLKELKDTTSKLGTYTKKSDFIAGVNRGSNIIKIMDAFDTLIPSSVRMARFQAARSRFQTVASNIMTIFESHDRTIQEIKQKIGL